jgi:hypothetical protein
VKHGIAREAKLAQDFSSGAHNLGQAFRAQHNQRDREDDSYFKEVQSSMTVRRNSMTSRRAEKLRAPATLPCQLIIIRDRGVNDA